MPARASASLSDLPPLQSPAGRSDSPRPSHTFYSLRSPGGTLATHLDWLPLPHLPPGPCPLFPGIASQVNHVQTSPRLGLCFQESPGCTRYLCSPSSHFMHPQGTGPAALAAPLIAAKPRAGQLASFRLLHRVKQQQRSLALARSAEGLNDTMVCGHQLK